MERENHEFECCKCESNELAYQKYVKCITPVSVQENSHIEYGLSIYDEDDYLAVSNGFCCADCGHLIEHCGIRMETEKALLDYLTMYPNLRDRQQSNYDEQLEAQIVAQEQ